MTEKVRSHPNITVVPGEVTEIPEGEVIIASGPLTSDALAEKLGVTGQFIADIENGNKGVSIKRLYLLCQILDVPADDILAGGYGPEVEDAAASMAREEIMAFLRKCDADQLENIGKIARIYADGVRMK